MALQIVPWNMPFVHLMTYFNIFYYLCDVTSRYNKQVSQK